MLSGKKGLVAPSYVHLNADNEGSATLKKEIGKELDYFSSNVEVQSTVPTDTSSPDHPAHNMMKWPHTPYTSHLLVINYDTNDTDTLGDTPKVKKSKKTPLVHGFNGC
ncbi:hypothetical protein EI94DRAFT_1816147 [Lactarius quietus]|nr:hypothetical protein EI94DRAFT_1816147 [Lactarius quietus]